MTDKKQDTTDLSALGITPTNWGYVFEAHGTHRLQPIVPSSFRFHNNTDEVGRFEIIDGQMTFKGNVEEATKVMIEYFTKQFNAQIRELIVAYGGDLDNVPNTLKAENEVLKAQVEQLQFELNVVNSRE